MSVAVILLSGALAVPPPAHGAASLAARQHTVAALPIVARIRVPVGPGWLATGYGSVWLSKSASHALLRIDPASNRVVATIPVGSDPELGIGVGFGAVWIADPKDHTLTQIDPQTNRVVRTLAVNLADETEGSFGVGEGGIWLLTNRQGTDSGTLTRVDPVSGRVTADIPVRPQSHAAVVAFHAVWVTCTGAGTVSRIDPGTNAVVAEIPVRSSPRFLAAGAGSLWVLHQGDGTLARIDPATNRVSAVVAVGVPGDGGDLAVADNSVWVSGEGAPLSQIDPRTNQLVRQFVGGEKDDTLRVGFGHAWVVDELNGQIWKISLERLSRMRP
jgi:virginiamycin B lyase